MKVSYLTVRNFRGLSLFQLSELGDLVVLVGANGAGKSTAFDAIRFVKSCYGSYHEQQEELAQFFAEKNMQHGHGLHKHLARDPGEPIRIEMRLLLTAQEIVFLSKRAPEIVRESLFQEGVPHIPIPMAHAAVVAQRMRRGQRLGKEAQDAAEEFRRALAQPIIGSVYVDADRMELTPSPVLTAICRLYAPADLGVFDFHGPDRTFQRENDPGQGALDALLQRQRQSALYNYSAKYSNLRGELSASFTRELLLRAGAEADLAGGRTAQIFAKLFATFLPDKTFQGPRVSVDGVLQFPIASDGVEHDVNELSSGEREIVLGYIRLIEAGFRSSVILIDEPELHLHPAICRSLPAFYQDTLISSGGNQVWLATHSEVLARSAQAIPNCTIVYVQPPRGEVSQAVQIKNDQSLDSAIVSLVGLDFRASKSVLLLEGEADAGRDGFDAHMIRRLFPKIARASTLVSVGSKDRVRKLLGHLRRVAAEAQIAGVKFYAIVDRDHGSIESAAEGVEVWDVFHIENYLLDPVFVLRALRKLMGAGCPYSLETEADQALKAVAGSLLPEFVSERLEDHANNILREAITLRVDRRAPAVATVLAAIENATTRVAENGQTRLDAAALAAKEASLRGTLEASLHDGTWREQFRGRDILKLFKIRCGLSLGYEIFRNVILGEMADASYQPPGMALTLARLADASAPCVREVVASAA